MGTIKTQKNDAPVLDFLNSVEDEKRRADGLAMLEIMKEITGEEPKMWGTSIVGFGEYEYKNSTGVVNKWMVTGFSPRKQALTLYIMSGFEKVPEDLMQNLGKYTTGKGCLYVKKLEDVDENVLRKLIKAGMKNLMGAI